MKENANEGARRTMDAMARVYGTDKGGQYHGYAAQYELALEPLRKEGVRVVVEIGVCRAWDGNRHICPSLAMWREWSGRDDCEVVGLDKCEFGVRADGIRTAVCDQGNAEALKQARFLILEEYGAADLIVDDGSHIAAHQQATMKALWPVLRVGGAYVIEDLNYNPEGERRERRVRGCVEAWQAGTKPEWLVDLRREMKSVGKIEWVDSAVAGKRSAVVLWKARDL